MPNLVYFIFSRRGYISSLHALEKVGIYANVSWISPSNMKFLAVGILQGLLGLASPTLASIPPWDEFIFSPSSRSPGPTAIHSILGDASATGNGTYTLTMTAGSRISMDFGVEVGGHVAFELLSASTAPLSLAFSESSAYVRNISDDTGAVPSMDWDQALEVTLGKDELSTPVHYHTPKERFRGGFRYLTFNAHADVVVSNIICEIGFAPNMPDLRNATGYFYTPDEESSILNRIWYAGAYTIQTNIVPNDTGRWLPQVNPGWAYNATLSIASPCLVDGAKRDRAIWPGDLGISGPIAMISLGQYGREAVHNSIETIFYYQNATTGLFPYAGPSTMSFLSGSKSDTYHAWALVSIYDYAMYSADEAWLAKYWDQIAFGVEYIIGNINEETGLQDQVNESDWARYNTGGFNSALNALAYHVLVSLASLSTDSSQAETWTAVASDLKAQYNALLWDADAGLYNDNLESDLKAQDGNSLALLYGLPETAEQRNAVSQGLELNWNDIGPVTPELNDTISPFISGLELLAHLHGAENPTRAMRLLGRLWGYMVDDSQMTGSTLVEGLSANGSLYYRSARGYDYDASYTSLSHAWSAAPTTALVTGVLGLRITEMGGRSWELRPQLGVLGSVKAGFDTGLGLFEASVEVADCVLVVEVSAPGGTRGEVIVPGFKEVIVNGEAYSGNKTIIVEPRILE